MITPDPSGREHDAARRLQSGLVEPRSGVFRCIANNESATLLPYEFAFVGPRVWEGRLKWIPTA